MPSGLYIYRIRHGMKKTAIYFSWKNMQDRCLNKNCSSYKNYGGRGIKICSEWLGRNGFRNFYKDMGDKPSDQHSIDRRDNNGNYEPDNCRWATRIEQANNKRNNRYYKYENESLTITQWCRKLGINSWTVKSRIKRGASFEEAITRPVRSIK